MSRVLDLVRDVIGWTLMAVFTITAAFCMLDGAKESALMLLFATTGLTGLALPPATLRSRGRAARGRVPEDRGAP